MTRKKRRILFILLAVVFLAVGPLTVFYSLGWRINWTEKSVTRPGALHIRAVPKNVEIFIDGKLKKKTDFFFGSAFIENLIPGRYYLEVKKEGFHDWQKNLDIAENQVTEAQNILLVPKNPEFRLAQKNVSGFEASGDMKKAVFLEMSSLEKSDGEPAKTTWSLKLFDLEKNIKSHLISEPDILSGKGPLKSVSQASLGNFTISPDGKKIIIQVQAKETLLYYLLDTEKTPLKPEYLANLGADVQDIDFSPQDPQKLIVLKEGRLTRQNLYSKEETSYFIDKVAAFYVSKDGVFYLDESGFVYKADFSLATKDRLNSDPLPLQKESYHKIAVSGLNVILREEKTIYFLNKEKKSFEKLSDQAGGFAFSPEGRKVAYFNGYEINVLFLSKEQSQPKREEGQRAFLTRFSEKIGKVFWLNGNYLIFNSGDVIKISEIDERDRVNMAELGSFKEPELFWNPALGKIIILSEKNLYISEKPIL